MINMNLKKLIASDGGDNFEAFCQAFCSRKYGASFRPIGGKKDGGRDGIVYLNPDKHYRVYQFSVDEKPKKKIEKTLERLKEYLATTYGAMTELVYITNQTIKDAETLQDDLEQQWAKRITIRDINWIFANLSSTDKTLDVATDFYQQEKVGISEVNMHPEVYLFFSLMANDEDGMIDRTLDIRSRVLDALVLQELIGTDSSNTMPRQELVRRITVKYQWVREKIIDTALKRLNERHSKKTNVRLINWHKKDDALCLPHDTVVEMRDRRAEATDICDFVSLKLGEYIDDVAPKSKEKQRAWQIFQEFLAKVFTKRGTTLLDWAETVDYALCSGDLDLLSQTLADRGIRDKTLHKVYQYAINALLVNPDKRIPAFLGRLNEAYLLHLVAGRDLKVHTVVERMRQSLQLVVCTSVVVPQLLEFHRTGTSLLKRASLAGVEIMTTDAYIQEIRNHFQDSLRADNGEQVTPNEITQYAAAAGKRVREVVEDLGLKAPNFTNLILVLNTILGIEVMPPINTKGVRIVKLAEALKPDRDNSFHKALADSSVFYYIKEHQERSRGHYTKWWLTRETATAKKAEELKVRGDRHVYMRPSFLQDMLLLWPSPEDLEEGVSQSWARDTLLMASPTDAVPNELLEPYRKAMRDFRTSKAEINKVKTINRMNAFMAIGKLDDRASPG